MSTEFTAEEVRVAGAMLANCAFNLAQCDRLTERERRSLDESRRAWDAALAQNAQGEAVGSEPCATVADAVRIADKCRSPDDEGVVWVPESCYLTMVGEIERLETLLYTDGNANIPLHAERARVPAESWTGEIECCDAKGFWLVLADNCPFVPGQRVTIAAAPSQPEE